MGEPNNALNAYMNDPERLRSVLEYYIGEKLPEGWTWEEEDGFYPVRNARGRLSFRQRDRIKRIRAGGYSFLLGLENQWTVNLTYPWRLMELDCRAYGAQIERIQQRNKGAGVRYAGGDDFKYRFRQEDRLDPVLNLTLYWGREEWERPHSLWEMTRIRDLPFKLTQLCGDYRVHLIPMRQIPQEALERMDSDLKYVLGLMKCTGSRREYRAYILAHKEYFSGIPRSAVDVIDVCTNLGDVRRHLEYTADAEGEEKTDMCKAVNDIMRYSRRQGVKKGVKKGERLLGSLVGRLLSEGRVEDAALVARDEDARARLYREYGIV